MVWILLGCFSTPTVTTQRVQVEIDIQPAPSGEGQLWLLGFDPRPAEAPTDQKVETPVEVIPIQRGVFTEALQIEQELLPSRSYKAVWGSGDTPQDGDRASEGMKPEGALLKLVIGEGPTPTATPTTVERALKIIADPPAPAGSKLFLAGYRSIEHGRPPQTPPEDLQELSGGWPVEQTLSLKADMQYFAFLQLGPSPGPGDRISEVLGDSPVLHIGRATLGEQQGTLDRAAALGLERVKVELELSLDPPQAGRSLLLLGYRELSPAGPPPGKAPELVQHLGPVERWPHQTTLDVYRGLQYCLVLTDNEPQPTDPATAPFEVQPGTPLRLALDRPFIPPVAADKPQKATTP
ncbi:MAG TPA: hypothetical protein PLA94_12705 [Myxococcota bacterium]|nr:hypothetical protein [Myxococcota bacterium]